VFGSTYLSDFWNNGRRRRGQNVDIAAITGTHTEKMMTKQNQQAGRQPAQLPRAARFTGPSQARPHHAPKPSGPKPPAPRPQGPTPEPARPQDLKPHPHRGPTTPLRSPERPAVKTPITKEDVKRIQQITALKNGGHQADWTKDLQSIADKREAQVAQASKQSGAGKGAGNGSGGKKKT
jgi:hypothetical protein